MAKGATLDQIPTDCPDSVEGEVVSLIPALRAYANLLCRNRNDADDLVQETLTKALANLSSFTPGTRLRAWLFTIMRNTFYNTVAKAKRESAGAKDCVSSLPVSLPTQEWELRGTELVAAVRSLPPHYRETLVLVVVLGESYEEAARICGCEVGTIKSRVNRARSMLIDKLEGEVR